MAKLPMKYTHFLEEKVATLQRDGDNARSALKALELHDEFVKKLA